MRQYREIIDEVDRKSEAAVKDWRNLSQHAALYSSARCKALHDALWEVLLERDSLAAELRRLKDDVD